MTGWENCGHFVYTTLCQCYYGSLIPRYFLDFLSVSRKIFWEKGLQMLSFYVILGQGAKLNAK
jgi:hypothetical protein